MKKHISQITLILILELGFAGCTNLYEEMNRNPNEVTNGQLDVKGYKIGTKLMTLQSLVIPVQEHMYQFVECLSGGSFAGYFGTSVDTWIARFDTYNPSADWRKWNFANVITATFTAYRGIVTGTDDEVAHALAKVLKVAIMQRVTDSYGPIPYSVLEDNESIYVGYDSQEDVYMRMFGELDEAIEIFRANAANDPEGFRRYDAVYYGDISKWHKFANSLKMRLAMRLSEVEPEIARAKTAEAVAAGVIETNGDNAAMHANENRSTLPFREWGDNPAGQITYYLTGLNDPRIADMLTPNAKGAYHGLVDGVKVDNKGLANTTYAKVKVEKETPYMWINAAMVALTRAEWEWRWGTQEQARLFYEKGIRLSFEQHNVSGAEAYINDDKHSPAAYVDPLGKYPSVAPVSTITVKWESGEDEAVRMRNFERIMVQKWIATFPSGTEAWAEQRRTGYPRLLPVLEDNSGGTVDVAHRARRLTYPVEEYQKNNANLQAAIQMLNTETQGSRKGDIMGTRVWWDCKPYQN